MIECCNILEKIKIPDKMEKRGTRSAYLGGL